MVWSDFEIPQPFIVENGKQRINFNLFANLVVMLVSSNRFRKIVRSTCGSKDVATRIFLKKIKFSSPSLLKG